MRLSLLFLVSGACVTSKDASFDDVAPPAAHAVGELGVCRAPTLEEATSLLVILQNEAPRVATLLGADCPSDVPEVWLVPELTIRAIALQDRILLSAEAADFADLYLTHELVHWYADCSVFEDLPMVAEEGLAEYLAVLLLPSYENDRREQYGAVMEFIRSGEFDAGELLSISHEEWLVMDDRRTEFACYALGFTIVDGIGLERLRVLCEEGAVSTDVLLSESGLTSN